MKSHLSQAQVVLNALKSGPKTMWQLTEDLRILRPGARIFELRKKHHIDSDFTEVQGRRVPIYTYRGPRNEKPIAPSVPERSRGEFRLKCKECGMRFKARRRSKFCNTTCRTANWKRQKTLREIEGQQSLEFCNERLRSEREAL